MNEIIFVMIRHVTTNTTEFWKESYKSIRKFYNNKIVIIDNNSDYNLVDNITLDNCEVIQSKIYESRLYSPYYELLSINFDRAVIIHDGTLFMKYVDFNLFNKVKYIWHFDTKLYDDHNIITKQLRILNNNNILFDTFYKKKYTGCMGCCMAITNDFLLELEDKFQISNLKDSILNQSDAIAFERTISILCETNYPEIINDISYEGEICNMVWGYNYSQYINNQKIFNSLDKKIDISNKSIIKMFAARK
jgi:hypothetical protein